MKGNLYIQYYKDKNSARQEEIIKCLGMNIDNKFIDTIYIFTDVDFDVVDSKLELIKHSGRVSYTQFFKAINKRTNINDINIIANSDIYFNHTIQGAFGIQKSECYALSRWDIDSNGDLQHYLHPDSQDCWIFKGKIKDIYGDFPLGKRGCDNRIAWEIQNAGYKITNPSKTIQACHLHLSGIRNYSLEENKDLIPQPYLLLPIT